MPLPKYVQEAFDSQNTDLPKKENLFTKEGAFGESISCLGDGLPNESVSSSENDLPDYVTKEIERRKQPDTDSQEWGTEWMRENPFLAGLYGAGKGLLEQAVAPSIEAVGMVVGSLGSPLLGTALGYGFAKQLNDILIDSYKRLGGEDIENSSIGEELLQSAADVGTVLIMGKAMDTGAKMAPMIENYLFKKLPERLYARAIKTPMSKKWIQTLPDEIVSKQTAAIEEGLRSRIPPSKYGLSKIKGLEKEVSGYIDDITKILSEDPSKVINREEILKKGLKDAYTKASHSSDPKGAEIIVNAISERFRAHPSTLTPAKANRIKRQLYKEIKYGLSEPSALKAQMDSIGKKGVAREIMLNLEQVYPALAELNATDAARIGLTEAIEKAYAREAQRNILPLGAKVLLRPKTWPLSIWEATMGHPQIKARLAFALHKANPVRYPAKPLKYTPPAIPPKTQGAGISKPLIKSPTGLTSAKEGTYTAKQLDEMLKSGNPVQMDTALSNIIDKRTALHETERKKVTIVNKMLETLKNESKLAPK